MDQQQRSRSYLLLLLIVALCGLFVERNLKTALSPLLVDDNDTSMNPPPKPKKGSRPSKSTKVRPATNLTMPTKYRLPKGIHPSKSRAPEAIELFKTDDPSIRKRHECIAKIRERTRDQLRPFVKTYEDTQTHTLLVDPAFHPNVGDNMIYYGEVQFLRSLGFDNLTIDTCSYRQADKFAQRCERHLKDQDPKAVMLSNAYWHGGGNWGDLYPYTQSGRITTFEGLLKANYSVVSMPESFFYQSDENRVKDTLVIKKSIAAGLDLDNLDSEEARSAAASRVTFCWRERKSFDEALREYPFVTNLLVPDIAFHLGPFNTLPSPQKEAYQLDILLFLREDKESVASKDRESIRRLLESIEGAKDLRFGIADWNTRFAMWPSDDYLFTESAIKLLSLGRVVICDRLHAAILCYLTGIPFVYMDQLTGKISKTLGVAFDTWEGCNDGDSAMWARAHSTEEAVALAAAFLEKYDLT